MNRLKYLRHPLFAYGVLTTVFLVLILVLPASKATIHAYNITPEEYRILLFLVELPLIAVWFTAFYAVKRLRCYLSSLGHTDEGDGFGRLTMGMTWLAWGLALPPITSLILNATANAFPGFHPAALIITNYLNLLFALVALSFIADGVQKLNKQSQAKISISNAKILSLLFIALGVLYCYLTFRHLDIHNANSTNNPYYLPGWLLILSITIPYLYAWFIGLLAAYDLTVIAGNAKGILYRDALRYVAGGFGMVIISSIGVQYIYSVVPRTGHLTLSGRLIAAYTMYAIELIGFVLVTAGISKLKKIEEV